MLRGTEQSDQQPVHVVARGKESPLVVRVSVKNLPSALYWPSESHENAALAAAPVAGLVVGFVILPPIFSTFSTFS